LRARDRAKSNGCTEWNRDFRQPQHVFRERRNKAAFNFVCAGLL
jgi:hypothetical protein